MSRKRLGGWKTCVRGKGLILTLGNENGGTKEDGKLGEGKI